MSSSLPTSVVLFSQSEGKYVRLGDPSASPLQVTATKVWTPQAKFEVERSEGHRSMVHIKSTYCNKYLRRSSCEAKFIGPFADEPNDDVEDWSTTLFDAEVLGTAVRLRHPQLDRYAQCVPLLGTARPLGSVVIAATGPDDPAELTTRFQFVDWASLVMLPRHVALKGGDGAYLGLLEKYGAALVFAIRDEKDKSIAHVVGAKDDATFGLENTSVQAFWMRDASNSILADHKPNTTPTSDIFFAATKVSDDTIVLKNLGNNNFCKRVPLLGPIAPGVSVLRANDSQVSESANLAVTELVTSRRIQDIEFQRGDGWITENLASEITIEVVTYNPSNETITAQVELRFFDTARSCTWEATNSTLKLGTPAEIKPTEIPSVNDSSEIELIAPFQPSFVWGENKPADPYQVQVYEVTLPPRTKVAATLTANKATCHVPFAYSSYDLLPNGEQEIHNFQEDGVFTGTNYFNFHFIPSPPQPISAKKK